MLKLQPIIKSDFKRINEITNNINIMKHIGNGKVWNEDKVKKFIHYNILEAKQNNSTRTEYYYKIILSTPKINNINNKTKLKTEKINLQKKKTKKQQYKNELIGIIGFFKQNNEYVRRTFIDEKYQGKGYAKQAFKLLIKKIKIHKPKLKYLISYVHSDNERMNLIAKRHQKYIGKSKIGKISVNKYLIYI